MKKRVDEMRDGEMGVIADWTVSGYIGRKVQRVGNDLIGIGEPIGKSWPGLFNSPFPLTGEMYQVDMVSTLEELANYKTERYYGLDEFSNILIYIGEFRNLADAQDRCDELSLERVDISVIKKEEEWNKIFRDFKNYNILRA